MYDVIIIGGGIIGLTTGYKLLRKNPDTKLLILEKEPELATHQTGHNSGVIHSGIYYKPGSLKAHNCREGVGQLLTFCDEWNIQYELCGKVIVAADSDEIPRLEDLFQRGQANGVPNLEMIGRERLHEVEPHAQGVKALLAPGTGIIDFTHVAQACTAGIENRDGIIKTSTAVTNLIQQTERCTVETNQGDFEANLIINCAGLYSDKVAKWSGLEKEIKIIPFRGEYFSLRPERKSLVNNLIYPVPDPRFPFLGVHFTRKIDGSVEAGPNAVLAFAREGYRRSDIRPAELWDAVSFTGFRKLAGEYWRMGMQEYWRSLYKPAFVQTLQRLVPEITSDDLIPGGSGVRAQLINKKGRLIDDFYITRNGRVINVLNTPSPAATSAFAIADQILKFI